MSADAAPTPLSKVDSAVQGLSSSPPKEEKAAKRRQSSAAAAGVYNIKDLGMFPFLLPVGYTGMWSWGWSEDDADAVIEEEGKKIEIAKETQKLNWWIYLHPLPDPKPSATRSSIGYNDEWWC